MSPMNDALINATPLGLSLFGLTAYMMTYIQVVTRPIVFAGNENIATILDKCPSLQTYFWPTPYCWNAHFQFVPFILRGLWDKYVAPPFEYVREAVELEDGEQIHLDWVVSCPEMRICGGVPDDKTCMDATPILVLHHGAMCDHADLPGQDYIAPALRRGWYVCVLTRRGHAGLKLTRPKWNFFGCPQELKRATQSILQRRPAAKLLTTGLSSGCAIVATTMGLPKEWNDFTAGVGISPGYDISKCMGRFTTPYKEGLLWKAKDYFLRTNEELLKHLPGYEACMNAKDLQEWLDNSYAMAGCESVEHYYEQYNPMNHIYRSETPSLYLNAENDPLCVVENFLEQNENMRNAVCSAGAVLTKTGSHCPFYEGLFLSNWAEKVTFEFFDSVLARERQKLMGIEEDIADVREEGEAFEEGMKRVMSFTESEELNSVQKVAWYGEIKEEGGGGSNGSEADDVTAVTSEESASECSSMAAGK
mmetsp:Transcript_8179/g.13592  ORF Transcript_8179/g.13592 Transcript_8179/m.13592 type:complete len:477 (+) Transcript_8179:46-1476(+)